MTKNQILARLIERGSNFRQFALAHDYNPRSVVQAVERYAGTNEHPRGILTIRILQDLSTTIGEPVLPGLQWQVSSNTQPTEQGETT